MVGKQNQIKSTINKERMIAKKERKWGCVAKDYAKTDGADAVGVNRPYSKVAPSLSARTRHGRGIFNLKVQSNKSCTET